MDDIIYYILFSYLEGPETIDKYLFFNYEITRDQVVQKINALLELDSDLRHNIQNKYQTPDGKIVFLKNIQEIVSLGSFNYSQIDSLSDYIQ